MSPTEAAYLAGTGLYLLAAVLYAVNNPAPTVGSPRDVSRARDALYLRALLWLPLLIVAGVRDFHTGASVKPPLYAPRHGRRLPPVEQREPHDIVADADPEAALGVQFAALLAPPAPTTPPPLSPLGPPPSLRPARIPRSGYRFTRDPE
jgi:hypothetical protein